MVYRLIITQSFEDDLDSVLQYISQNLHSPIAANRLLNKVSEITSSIHDNPFLYPKYHDEKLSEKGYHYAVAANYLIFYKIYEAESLISIMRFLYGGQDVINILN